MNKRFHLCTVVYEGEVRTVRDNSLIGEKSLSSQEVVDLLNTFDEQHRLMKEVLQEKIDEKYYINVLSLMVNELPRPKMKPLIFVTGWGEWLPLVIE